jgi:hypothetical protein
MALDVHQLGAVAIEAPRQHPALLELAIVRPVADSAGLQPSRSTSTARWPSTVTGSARWQGGIDAAGQAARPLARALGRQLRRPAAVAARSIPP